MQRGLLKEEKVAVWPGGDGSAELGDEVDHGLAGEGKPRHILRIYEHNFLGTGLNASMGHLAIFFHLEKMWLKSMEISYSFKKR